METDQTGAFRFPAVPSGAHELHFEKAGFIPVTFPIQVSPEEKYIDVGSVIMQIGKVAKASLHTARTSKIWAQPKRLQSPSNKVEVKRCQQPIQLRAV